MVGHADCAGKKDFRPIVAVTVAVAISVAISIAHGSTLSLRGLPFNNDLKLRFGIRKDVRRQGRLLLGLLGDQCGDTLS